MIWKVAFLCQGSLAVAWKEKHPLLTPFPGIQFCCKKSSKLSIVIASVLMESLESTICLKNPRLYQIINNAKINFSSAFYLSQFKILQIIRYLSSRRIVILFHGWRWNIQLKVNSYSWITVYCLLRNFCLHFAYAALKICSLVNQAVQLINSPLSLSFSFSIIFNILFSLPSLQEEKRNVKNDGKENIMLKVSLIDNQLGLPSYQSCPLRCMQGFP